MRAGVINLLQRVNGRVSRAVSRGREHPQRRKRPGKEVLTRMFKTGNYSSARGLMGCLTAAIQTSFCHRLGSLVCFHAPLEVRA